MIQRGEVWWATLPAPVASEPGYRRPVLVIQSDEFNRSLIRTVVVVVVTSNLRLAEAPGNVLLSRRETGLPKRSVANVSQLMTLDRSFLTARIGRVSARQLQEVESGIRLVLSL